MRTYQIIIDDVICRWGYSKQYLRRMLDQYKGKHVDMRISSLGGDLDHGLDIRQQLLDHGDVNVYLTGFVASAATIIAMGAKRVCMSKYAMFLVHKCSNFIDAWGNYNADQMQQLIDELTKNKKENDRIDVVIAQLYAKKTGKSINELLNVLKEGRWLTAQEALDYGFIDEITEDEGDVKQNLTPELRAKFNAFGITIDGIEDGANDSEPVRRSILQKILDSINSFTSGSKTDSAEDVSSSEAAESEAPETTETESEPQNSKTPMNRLVYYSAILAALSVKDLPVNEDGSVTLSQVEMETINNRLASLNGDLATRDNTIKELNSQVENLKKLPGDDTKGNLDDTAKGELTDEEMYNLAKSLLD